MLAQDQPPESGAKQRVAVLLFPSSPGKQTDKTRVKHRSTTQHEHRIQNNLLTTRTSQKITIKEKVMSDRWDRSRSWHAQPHCQISADCTCHEPPKKTWKHRQQRELGRHHAGRHITLQFNNGCPLKLSRVEPGQYLDGRPHGKTRLLLEEVLVRPAGGAPPGACVGPNAPV